jgi:hypothetical protein
MKAYAPNQYNLKSGIRNLESLSLLTDPVCEVYSALFVGKFYEDGSK